MNTPRNEHYKSMGEVEKQSLADRQEAQAEYLSVMQSENWRIVDAAEHILMGNYGEGAYTVAREIVPNKRQNRVAGLALLVAQYEFGCPSRQAAAAYNKLLPAEKKEINGKLQIVIDEALAEMKAD